jgi:hypothetical protein
MSGSPELTKLRLEVRMAMAEKERQRAINDLLGYVKVCQVRIESYNRRIAGYKAAMTVLKTAQSNGPRPARSARRTRTIELP